MEQREQRRKPMARKKPEDGFKDKVLDLRRVTRVVAGGKRFRFRATVVVGNEKGSVGVGVAKGADVAQAVEKARVNAKKNMVTVKLKESSIPHEVEAKYSAARIKIKPAGQGHGLRAGGATRVVLSLLGVKDGTAKALGTTSNKLTNALAALEALKKIKEKKKIIFQKSTKEIEKELPIEI